MWKIIIKTTFFLNQIIQVLKHLTMSKIVRLQNKNKNVAVQNQTRNSSQSAEVVFGSVLSDDKDASQTLSSRCTYLL